MTGNTATPPLTGTLRMHLREGENEVVLRVVTFQAPNSRWYSGAGIYRECLDDPAAGDTYSAGRYLHLFCGDGKGLRPDHRHGTGMGNRSVENYELEYCSAMILITAKVSIETETQGAFPGKTASHPWTEQDIHDDSCG